MKKNQPNTVYQADGVIINVNQTIKLKKKSFHGININGYKINVPNECKREKFDDNEMYESILLCKTQFQNVSNRLREDNIKIISLTGNNGVIEEKEYAGLK